MLKQVYKSYHVLNTATGPDYKFFEQFCSPLAYEDEVRSFKTSYFFLIWIFEEIIMIYFSVANFQLTNIVDHTEFYSEEKLTAEHIYLLVL